MSKQKTIWYISKYIAPPTAAKVGARGFFLLEEFVKNGCRAILFTSDSNHLVSPPLFNQKSFHETVENVEVYWLKTFKYDSARSLRRMISWLDFEWQLFCLSKKNISKPDIIIASSLSLLSILNGLRLKKKYKCKLVFEVRDIWPMVLTEAGKISPWNPFVLFLGWVEKLGYKRSDVIVGTMPNLSEHVKNVLGVEKAVHCIPQGVPPTLLKPASPLPETFINSFIPKNKFIVCHAGSIGADNALETLMTCAFKLQNNKDIHFLIVGEGYLKKKFQEETKELENITFAPRIEKDQVQSLLSHVEVVYFASHPSPIWRFGQSLNKVVDYMYSGKPIIASYSGYPSMINEADCGVFVPAGDVDSLVKEIERFSQMPEEERNKIGKRGRDWLLQNRTYSKLAKDYLDILN